MPTIRRPAGFDEGWCEQVPQDDTAVNWLIRSRDAGYLPAILEFSRLQEVDQNPPGADAADIALNQKRFIDSMRAAAQQGSLEAMLWFAATRIGDAPPDPVTGYAYSLAAAQELQSVVSQAPSDQDPAEARYLRRLGRSIDFASSQLAPQLSSDQMVEAASIKDSIVNATPCCLLVLGLH
jgi:hypothetical protein